MLLVASASHLGQHSMLPIDPSSARTFCWGLLERMAWLWVDGLEGVYDVSACPSAGFLLLLGCAGREPLTGSPCAEKNGG